MHMPALTQVMVLIFKHCKHYVVTSSAPVAALKLATSTAVFLTSAYVVQVFGDL